MNDLKNLSHDLHTSGKKAGGTSRRPVLQRQQRQSSEETTESGRSANVHFKEDPEYFEAKDSDIYGKIAVSSELLGIPKTSTATSKGMTILYSCGEREARATVHSGPKGCNNYF